MILCKNAAWLVTVTHSAKVACERAGGLPGLAAWAAGEELTDGYHNSFDSTRFRRGRWQCRRYGPKKYSLGTLGNSIAGILGGGIGAQILGTLIASTAEGILDDVDSGTIGDAVLMIIVRVIKQMMGK
jgi:uncharacterized membrane protein YeaQ/YmgE (transglycosylase-associated protein family)